MQGKGTRRRRRTSIGASMAAVAATAALALPAGAGANVPFTQITSPGPISDIYLGNELSCQVKLTQDQLFSYFPPSTAPGDCGTFLKIVGQPNVYAPNFGAHDATAADNPSWVPWTPQSQSAVSGAGTASDPYSVTTRAKAGANNVFVRETYTYVSGSRQYGIRIEVINNAPGNINVKLYHAVDCYLAGSDVGYGAFDGSTGGVSCTESPNNSPAGRTLGFTPVGGGANYIESSYNTVWDRTDGTDYPNTFEPNVFQDNGAGLQWNLTVPGGGTNEISGVDLSATVDSGDALETAITSGPKKVKLKKKKKKAKATFAFTATLGGVAIPNATFQCTADDKAPVPCTSPYTTKYKKGKHTFSVVAAANGETDGTPAAAQFKVKRKKK